MLSSVKHVTLKTFLQLSTSDIMNIINPSATELKRFRQFDSVSFNIRSVVYGILMSGLLEGAAPIHLLCALELLKSYSTEAENSDTVGCSEKCYISGSGSLFVEHPILI